MTELFVVVVGAGRLGSRLADALSRRGDAVVVIDRDPQRLAALPASFGGFRVEGDASHLAVLRQAGLEKADVVIATTHADNANLMVAQVARRVFGVPHVVARVYDPSREAVYARLGIETICPTTVAAELFLDTVERTSARRARAGGARP